MKERPILFSGEMVRAILEGRKTQTRRVIKEANDDIDISHVSTEFHSMREYRDGSYRAVFDFDGCLNAFSIKCPYGRPGDRLWVRESFSCANKFGDTQRPRDFGKHEPRYTAYRASAPKEVAHLNKWRPSIHMPRWASRIILEITGIRVERVQNIIPEDAIREGYPFDAEEATGPETYIEWFRTLWNSINIQRGYGWNINPWVWVVGFRMLPGGEAPK